jgi:NDP-sugar pyrophosphorylase family protein
MVERLLGQVADAEIPSATVIAGWYGGLVSRRLEEAPGLRERIAVEVWQETEPLGTLGALREIGIDGRRILFVFGDLVTDLRFELLLEHHAARGRDLTLASHVERHRVRLGEIVVDAEDGEEVVGYREKPEKEFLICSGIAVLEPCVVASMPPTPRRFGFDDLVRAALEAGCTVGHWRHGAFWIDVNSPEALAEAEAHFQAEIREGIAEDTSPERAIGHGRADRL